MAINSKDIEALWKRYSDEGVKKGISVVQFFESNGVPYHTFEKWYKKKFSENGIVDCVVGGLPDGTVQIPDSEKPLPLKPEKRNDVYVSYVNIGLSNGLKIEHHRLSYGGFSSELGGEVAAAWLTFVESCKLQKKAALEVFNGYFQRIAEGRRDYDLITEEVLC